jgi:hypothetical protein
MTTIAFLGLGAMGSRMALNLAKAGFAVTVWNRDPARAEALGLAGARIAGSPRAAAQGADVVFSMVTDDRAARAIWLRLRRRRGRWLEAWRGGDRKLDGLARLGAGPRGCGGEGRRNAA